MHPHQHPRPTFVAGYFRGSPAARVRQNLSPPSSRPCAHCHHRASRLAADHSSGGGRPAGAGGGHRRDDGDSQPPPAPAPPPAFALAAFGSNRDDALPAWLRNVSVTQFLLLFTIAMFLAQLATADRLTVLLMKQNELIAAGAWHRLFMPVFLHASVTHLFVNCLSLHYTGPVVESWFGAKRFAALYAFGGLTGNLASYCFTPAPGVGASGAIFGLIGALATLLFRHRKLLGRNQSERALRSLGLTVTINFAIGLMPGTYIDNFAHLGGLLGGVLFAYVAGPRLRKYTSLKGSYLVDEPLLNVWLTLFLRLLKPSL